MLFTMVLGPLPGAPRVLACCVSNDLRSDRVFPCLCQHPFIMGILACRSIGKSKVQTLASKQDPLEAGLGLGRGGVRLCLSPFSVYYIIYHEVFLQKLH